MYTYMKIQAINYNDLKLRLGSLLKLQFQQNSSMYFKSVYILITY